MSNLDEIKSLLATASDEHKFEVYCELRKQFPIHEIEARFNTTAEIILEAIARSSELTIRGIRGVIAEASFLQSVVRKLLDDGWRDETPIGNFPFDFILNPGDGPIKIQVKMQRQEAHKPKVWKARGSKLPTDLYVVETQKTRGGKDSSGAETRPYRFGEFDILAVSLHPSTLDWSKFVYTVADWLLPRPDNTQLMQVLQPVSAIPNDDWTNDLRIAARRFGERKKKSIFDGVAPK